MSKIFKIGVVGLTRGSAMCEVLATQFENTKVTAICEKNSKVVDACRRYLDSDVKVYDDYDEFLKEDLDAVVLANYFHEHAPFAIKAMEAGMAVLSETTAAATLGECVQLVEAAERTNGRYMLAANCLYFPAVHAMKPMIAEQKYGKVLFAEAEYIHGYEGDINDIEPADPKHLHWRQTEPSSYYNMHTLGPLMYITNSMPVKVFSKGSYDPEYCKKVGKMTDCPTAFVMTEMDNGSVFNTTGCASHHPNSKWYRVVCEHGTMETVRYNYTEDLLHTCERGHQVDQTWYNWRRSGVAPAEYRDGVAERFGHGGIDYFMCYYFKEFLEGKSQPFFDVYRSATLSAVGILSWYSALTGKEYAVPDFTKKEDRDTIRDDFRSPFGTSYDELTMPCRLEDKALFKEN